MTRQEISEALANPNLAAFLRVIRAGEGTSEPNGYLTMFGGEFAVSFADHPRRAITKTLGGEPITSTAAGAYQFLASTWDGLVKQYGFHDFSPPCQDQGAAALIAGRGALDDVLAGRFESAIKKCNREWASLPGSPYGQPTLTMARAKTIYAAAGGSFAAPEPAQVADAQPPAPVEEQSIPAKPEHSMIPAMIPIALQAISSLVPALATIFGDKSKPVPERNMAAAVKVVDVAKQAIGAVNEQELVEKIQADPEAAQSVTAAVQEVYFELSEAGGGGIEGARSYSLKAAETPAWKQPAFLITLTVLPLIYIVVCAVIFGEGWDSNIRSFVVGVVVGSTLGAVVAFWLGSSFGSSKKTDAMLKSVAG